MAAYLRITPSSSSLLIIAFTSSSDFFVIAAISFTDKRAFCLNKSRISVYTNGQLDADDIFDTAKEKIDIYYKTLFYASAGIPRSLGYILKYSFLNSINKGNGITVADLNNASKTYFVNNILADFCNDSRYKESFFDENKILTQMTQKKLMDDLIEMAKTIKRGLIEKYTGKQSIKDIYKQTIEKYKSGIT